MILLNPRKRRRSRKAARVFRAPRVNRRRKHSRRKAGFFSYNPSAAGVVGSVKKGFSLGAIGHVVPLAAGVLANRYLQDKVSQKIGWNTGFKNSVVGFGTAGLLGMVPKYGKGLFIGGMMQTTLKALLPYVPGFEGLKPTPPPPVVVAPAPETVSTMRGFGVTDDDVEHSGNIDQGYDGLEGLGRPFYPAMAWSYHGDIERSSIHSQARKPYAAKKPRMVVVKHPATGKPVVVPAAALAAPMAGLDDLLSVGHSIQG